MTPTVEHDGYKEMMMRLQEEASDANRTRTRDAIERLAPRFGTATHVENTFSAQQHEENGREVEAPFFHGFNSTMEEPKRKYYAVRQGRVPGIYRTWDSCEKQVEGYSGCEFKSFKTKEDAHQYLATGISHQSHDDFGSQNAFEDEYLQHPRRNDAVGPMPGTALRQNVTQRRSQGRTKDRVSMGETSVPVEMLVARKSQPREKDLEYQSEAQLYPSTHHSTTTSDDESGSQVEELQGGFTSIAQDLWDQKSRIEEDMYSALEESDEATYRALEITQREVNAHICLILSGHLAPKTRPNEANGVSQSNGTTSVNSSYRTPSSRTTHESASMTDGDDSGSDGDDNQSKVKDWKHVGSPYLIYLATRATVVPWTVWATMPVSFLIQAAVTLLARTKILATAEAVILVHEGRIMEVDGLLSDYPVLVDDVVTVNVTVPWGGSISDRKAPTDSRIRAMSTSKPMPTTDPKMESRQGRAGGRRESTPNGNKSGERRGTFNRLEDNCNENPYSDDKEEAVRDSRSYDKIKQTFKCPKFSGQTKDWKQWNKGFQRYLSIWDLGHVLDPEFFEEVPLSKAKMKDNKFVYYILEDATQSSALASSYVRQAPIENGFEAFYTLHDGFVFAGATASTILINELSNFRFKQSETPTELIMRLEELFQDLEMLPNEAALVFNDTQKIGYLLGALRHESQWATVASTITSEQLKGKTTFRQACEELKVRCEADKAYSLIDKQVHNKKKVHGLKTKIVVDGVQEESTEDGGGFNDEVKALISSMSKRLNQIDETGTPRNPKNKKGRRIYEQRKCIAKDCAGQSTFLLCGLHYHSMVSGKTPTVELENGWGQATFSTTTNSVVYPPGVPKDLLPKPKSQ
jgi:hypothetical protein